MHQNRLSVSWCPAEACCASGNEVSGYRRETERPNDGCSTSASDLWPVWSVEVAVPTESGGSRDEAGAVVDGRRKRVLALLSGFRKMA